MAKSTAASGDADGGGGGGGGGGANAAVAVVVPAAPDAAEAAEKQQEQQEQQRDIYSIVPPRRRYLYLAVVSFTALIVPLTDTVYLPALLPIQQALQTSTELVAASVAVYMFAVSVAALFWGPASDRFGRRVVFIVSSLAFLAFTVVCIFAPSIGVLVAFRSLQGTAIAAFGATGSGVVADVFPPAQRGMALGISSIPLLLGPLLGPILGGALSQRFSWRATFVLIAALGVLAVLAVVFVLRETEQHRVLRKLVAGSPGAADGIAGAAEMLARPKPKFAAPWVPVLILLERRTVLHAAFVVVVFGSMFCSLTEMPLALARPPYSLSVAAIGLTYIPGGLAGLLASPIGGKLSDAAAAAHPSHAAVRLVWNTALTALLMPLSLVLFGWALELGLHLAVVMVGSFFVAFSTSFIMPALFSYLTVTKQRRAAAAAAGVHSLMFLTSGVLILVAAAAGAAIGVGRFMSVLAALNIAAGGAAFAHAFAHRHESISLSRAASRAALGSAESAASKAVAAAGEEGESLA